MKFNIEFDFRGKTYQFCRSLDDLARNYDDEGYAYFLEEIPTVKYGLFEINLLKKEADNSFTGTGYVAVYHNADGVSPDECMDARIEIS